MSRSERKSGLCGYCGSSLPPRSHSSRLYCNARCRRKAFAERAHQGRIGSVRRLQNSKISVTVHMQTDLGLKPGDVITFAKTPAVEV